MSCVRPIHSPSSASIMAATNFKVNASPHRVSCRRTRWISRTNSKDACAIHRSNRRVSAISYMTTRATNSVSTWDVHPYRGTTVIHSAARAENRRVSVTTSVSRTPSSPPRVRISDAQRWARDGSASRYRVRSLILRGNRRKVSGVVSARAPIRRVRRIATSCFHSRRSDLRSVWTSTVVG